MVVWCDNLCSATALAHRLLGDCWLCATCFWVSCLVPSARRILMCLVWSVSYQGPISFPICPAAEPRNCAIELALNLPKLDLSVTVAVLQLERAVSHAARVAPAESTANEDVASDEELAGQSNM